jgi:hypothetical protein
MCSARFSGAGCVDLHDADHRARIGLNFVLTAVAHVDRGIWWSGGGRPFRPPSYRIIKRLSTARPNKCTKAGVPAAGRSGHRQTNALPRHLAGGLGGAYCLIQVVARRTPTTINPHPLANRPGPVPANATFSSRTKIAIVTQDSSRLPRIAMPLARRNIRRSKFHATTPCEVRPRHRAPIARRRTAAAFGNGEGRPLLPA